MDQAETCRDEFGGMLRERREALGLSRAALARAVRASESTIKAIELGQRKPSEDLLRRLSRCGAVDDAAQARSSSVLNCWIAPGFSALRMLGDLIAKANAAGGSIEQSLLYLDHASAAAWCALTGNSAYVTATTSLLPEKVIRSVLRRADSAPLDVIALGCGSARREVALCRSLIEESGGVDLRLYLLDISQPLLSEAYAYAAESLEMHPHVSVTAVQGNFHDLPRYGALLYRAEHSHRRRLITMLGYTFGNLDNELRWVADTLAPFARGDLFLIDVQRGYAPASDANAIRRNDPGLQPGAQSLRQREIEQFILGPLRRYRQGGAASAELRNELGSACVVPGSYQIEQCAYLSGDGATRRFVLIKARRYSIPELAQAMADLGWHMVEHAPSGDDKRAPISQLLFERR